DAGRANRVGLGSGCSDCSSARLVLVGQVRPSTNSSGVDSNLSPGRTTLSLFPGPLLDLFSRPAVAAGPIGAFWAGFSFGVVDTFFVRTPNDSVSNDNRFDLV